MEITKTYNSNGSLGINDATSLRRRLGIVKEYFDKRLLGAEITPRFQFNAQEYDLIYCSLLSKNMTKLASQVYAYEILALSKWYDEKYDKIMPLVLEGKLSLSNNMIARLNYTRPSNNKIGVTINTPRKDLSKELVD